MTKQKKTMGEKKMTYYIKDIQVTETAESIGEAREIAESWMDVLRSILQDADDDDVRRWARSGSRGLDAGDVEIWCDDELVESYSGRELIEAEADRRGIYWVC